MMRNVLAFLALVPVLTGCNTPAEPRVQIVEKAVPTKVPCVGDETTAPPTYPDTDEALRDAEPGQAVRLLGAGRILRNQRLAELEPLIAACRKPPPPS